MSYKKVSLTPRQLRQKRVRRKVRGTTECPRLCIFRSARHIYVQAIDDISGATIASASTLDPGYKAPEDKGKIAQAKAVGELIAKRLVEKNFSKVVFDRNGFLYHGRVQALAQAARDGGLIF